ncbi:hypothetical protein ElyMa_004295900 [Elysia marginata]|uniref:SPOC domain-containing protein n=1 Tax=Elysia marginata TaxID=1093978 RepID=A0AAV4GW42_9GAST|nr:hypothetical protein ElyMa_004295900 [Elysia marginata]
MPIGGKCKSLNIGNVYTKSSTVEPTPNYDSHISTAGPTVDENVFLQKAKADIYLYEYDEECEPVKRPRQCLPHAIIKVRMKPIPEKVTIPPPPPSVSQRPALENSTLGSAYSAVNPMKQNVSETATLNTAVDVSQDCPSPFLKDNKHQAVAKVKYNAVSKEDNKQSKSSSKGPIDEKKREEMRNSYLHRLSLAKATVEAKQSRDFGGFGGLTNLLPGETGVQHAPNKPHIDSFSEALDVPSEPVPDQSMYHKTVGSAKLPIVTPSIQDELAVSAVNLGPNRRVDPRLARSISNPVSTSSAPRPDPRLAKLPIDEKQPSCKPEAATFVPRPSVVSSKSALKVNNEVKRLSLSDYKKLNNDSLTKRHPEKLSADIKTKVQDTSKPVTAAQVLPMPISFMDTTKLPPKPTKADQQTASVDNSEVPLPSFYHEYTPDGDYSCQDVDFNQFQSPVKASSLQTASLRQFQSPVPNTAKNLFAQVCASSPQKKSAHLPKKSLLPLPVINSDGSISNVLRGFVDGTITEIKTPPQASQSSPKVASSKLLIEHELVSNTAKNLAKAVASNTDTPLQGKNSTNCNADDGLAYKKDRYEIALSGVREDDRESPIPLKSIVDERTVKGLLKGFQKGLSGKSESSSQSMDLVNETQYVSQKCLKNNPPAITDKECIVKTKNPNEIASMSKDEVRQDTEKRAFSDVQLKKSGNIDAQRRSSKLVDQTEEVKGHQRIRGKNPNGNGRPKERNKNQQTRRPENRNVSLALKTEKDGGQQNSNVKLVCSPPPLPLIPFLVTDDYKADQREPESFKDQQSGQNANEKEVVTKAIIQTSDIAESSDPLDSGMWVAPSIDQLTTAVELSTTLAPPGVKENGPEIIETSVKLASDDTEKKHIHEKEEEYNKYQYPLQATDSYSKVSASQNRVQVSPEIASTEIAEAQPATDTVLVKTAGTGVANSSNVLNSFDESNIGVKSHLPSPNSLTVPHEQCMSMPEHQQPSIAKTCNTTLSQGENEKDEKASCDNISSSDVLSCIPGEEQTYTDPTKSLTLQELGFISTLHVMSDTAFQPNTMLVDCVEALNENYPLNSCLECEKLLPPSSVKFTQDYLDRENQEQFEDTTEEPQETTDHEIAPSENAVEMRSSSSSSQNNESQKLIRMERVVTDLKESCELDACKNDASKAALFNTVNPSIGKTASWTVENNNTCSHAIISSSSTTATMTKNNEILMEDVTAIDNTVTSTKALETTEQDPHLSMPSTSHGEADNSKYGQDSSEANEMPLASSPNDDDKIESALQNASSVLTYPNVPTPSTKPNSKELSLNPSVQTYGVGKDQEASKNPLGTEVLKPLDKLLNSHSNMGVQSERQGLAGDPESITGQKADEANSKPFEKINKEEGYWRNWDQNCPIGNEWDDASKQREQRKTILMQVLKQKEKIKKSFERHRHFEMGKNKEDMRQEEKTESKAMDEAGKVRSKENQKEKENNDESSWKNLNEDKCKGLDGNNLQQTDNIIPTSVEVIHNESLCENRQRQVPLPSPEIEYGKQKIWKDSHQTIEKQNKQSKTIEHVLANKSETDMCPKINKEDRKEISPSTNRKQNSFQDISEESGQQRDSGHLKQSKDKKEKDEREGRKSNESEHYQKDRNKERDYAKSDSGKRDAYMEDCKHREKRDRSKREYERSREKATCQTKENLKRRENKQETYNWKGDVRTLGRDDKLHKSRSKELSSRGTLAESHDKVNKTRWDSENKQSKCKEQKDSSAKDIPLANSKLSGEKFPVSVKKGDEPSAKGSEVDITNKKSKTDKSLPQNDKNSNHLVHPKDRDCPGTSSLLSSSSLNVESEKLVDSSTRSQRICKQVASVKHTVSTKERFKRNDDSDEEFGAPKKIIKPLKKKICINLPTSAQKENTKDASISSDEVNSSKSVCSTSSSVSTLSPAVSSSLSSISLSQADTEIEPSSNPTSARAENDAKQTLSINIPETMNLNACVAEELYSPSNPTAEDQASYGNAFEDKFELSLDNTIARSNQLINKSSEQGDSNGGQNVSKLSQGDIRAPTNQAPGNRNVFSLYTDYDVTDPSYYSYENNDFGDVDYRHGNPSNFHMSVYEESYNYKNDSYSSAPGKGPSYGANASQRSTSLWDKEYYSTQETFPPFDAVSSFSGEEAGYWQGFQSTNFNNYGDTDYREQIWKISNYSNEPVNLCEAKPDTDDIIHTGSLTEQHSSNPFQVRSHGSEWSQNPNAAQNHSQNAHVLHTPHGSQDYDDYWSQPTSSSNATPPVKTSPLDEFYSYSDASVHPKQTKESQSPGQPVSETTVALQKMLPEMFIPAAYEQKCKEILKAFSPKKPTREQKSLLPVEDEESNDADDMPVPTESVGPIKHSRAFSILSQQQETPSTGLLSQRPGEMSSVERLKEILATVKRNAKITRGIEAQTLQSSSEIQATNQAIKSEGNGQLLPTENNFVQETETNHHPHMEDQVMSPGPSPAPLPMTTKASELPGLSSTSQIIDQLVQKIGVEGISLQNLTSVDSLKKVLSHLTEKIHASASESDTKSPEKFVALKSPMLDSEEKRPPVISLKKIFQSSDLGHDSEDDVKTASGMLRGNRVDSNYLKQHLGCDFEDDVKTASEVLRGNRLDRNDLEQHAGQLTYSSGIENRNNKCTLKSTVQTLASGKNLMIFEHGHSASSMTDEKELTKTRLIEGVDVESTGACNNGNQTHKSDKTVVKLNDGNSTSSRLVREDDTGGLCIKVSNSRSSENASKTWVRSQSSAEDIEPKSEEAKSAIKSDSKLTEISKIESSDSRVVVIESSSSACDSPVVTGPPTQSSSNLSVTVRKDGKVYLSDVPMDVLAFARDKILDQINELIDDAENDTNTDAKGKDEDSVDANLESYLQTTIGKETPQYTIVDSEAQEVDNDTEDGEIKDNDEDELSDATICRDEPDLDVNTSGINKDVDHEISQSVNISSQVYHDKKNSNIIEVSSESDRDVLDEPMDRKTTRGVFCKKGFGPLKLSPSYIESCKKKLKKKKHRRKSKSKIDEGVNDLTVDDDLKYSDISEASNGSEDMDSQLQHAVTSPLRTQISSTGSPPSTANKVLDLNTAKSSGVSKNTKPKKRKKSWSGRQVQLVEENTLEKADTSVVNDNDLLVAIADSSSDWSKHFKSTSTKRKLLHCLEKRISALKEGKGSTYAQPSELSRSDMSPDKVSSSVSERVVASVFGNNERDSDASPPSEKKVVSKVCSVILRPETLDMPKSYARKSPKTILEKDAEKDQTKKVIPAYSSSAKLEDNRSLFRDCSKRKRSVSPFLQSKPNKNVSPKSARVKKSRASRSSSRGKSRRDRSPSLECKKRSKSPVHFRLKKFRRSRSPSRDYNRRHRSRSGSISPPKYNNKRGHRGHSDRNRSPSSLERRRYSRYSRDLSPAAKKKRANSPRRSSSRSLTPDIDLAATTKKRRLYRRYSGEKSPSPCKKFNNELDYYTLRQPCREKSPVWKDLPSLNFSSSDKQAVEGTTSKTVDYLGLDYFTTKRRRSEASSSMVDERRDSRVVKLNTPEKKLSEFEELMNEYERDRHRKQNICNVTIEQLIMSHYGTIVTKEVKDAFPLSFETSITHDSKGCLRAEEDMCKFGKMVLEAYGVATNFSDNPVGTASIDFRSRCFDEECGENQLQEFSDHQILLEVNVIKQCQAILHANDAHSVEPSTEEMLKQKNLEQVSLKAKLLLMEDDRENVSSQELKEVKSKLDIVEEEFLVLMQACVRQKQLQASKDLPEPDLPEVLRVSTADFQFCQSLHPMQDGKEKADLEALLDQVAGDILELYKCPDFGRAHFRVPDLLLLHEEKRGLYAVCGTPLILHSPMPRGAFLSLLTMRQKLESLGSQMRDSAEGKRLLTARSETLSKYVDEVKRARVNKLRDRMKQFTRCSDFLEKVLGSDGLRKLRVFETYKGALRWHFRFLDQEFAEGHQIPLYVKMTAILCFRRA